MNNILPRRLRLLAVSLVGLLLIGAVGLAAASGTVAEDTHSVSVDAPETAEKGEEVLIKANVTAGDRFPGEQNATVELLVDGEVANTTTVTVTRHDPGEAAFAGEFYDPGERNVTVIANVTRGGSEDNLTATNTTNITVMESERHVAAYNENGESFRALSAYEKCRMEAEETLFDQDTVIGCMFTHDMFWETVEEKIDSFQETISSAL